MTRRVCVVTSGRAEYGLLRWIMEGIEQSAGLELQVIATGMHLSPEFGLTYRQIEADGFHIDARVEMLLSSDTGVGIAKSMGLGLIGCADALHRLRPDLLVVLGDRFEILAVAAAALVARIPVAHLHGGETTEGAFDESIRHSITKMSHLHFVAAPEYARRVVQLGEDPARVFCVGGLGVDSVRRARLLDRESLERELDFRLGARNLIVTYHPETLDTEQNSERYMGELLAALESVPDIHLIFTMPNADTNGRRLAEMVREFVAGRRNARLFTALGELYLSCMQHVDGVVGNSSSGLIEAPALKKGTVNIGDRQRGRLKAASVIDCAGDRAAVAAALGELYSPEFQSRLPTIRNPYGEGGAAGKIVATLESHALEGILKKRFFDLHDR